MQPILANLDSKSRGKMIDDRRRCSARRAADDQRKSKYDERDVSLYALGVGRGRKSSATRTSPLVYEMSGEGFHTLPTFAVVPAMKVTIPRWQARRQSPA